MKLSASMVKEWFQYRCERKLVYSGMSRTDLESIPIIMEQNQSVWSDFGNECERAVFARLIADNPGQVVGSATGGEQLSAKRTERFLTRQLNETIALQARFCENRPRLKHRLRLPEDVELKRGFTDVIQVFGDSKPIFRLVDIKATRAPTLFHKSQLAFYSLLLDATLEDLETEGTSDEIGSIWCLPENPEREAWVEHDFVLRPYREMVREFLRHDLALMAAKKVTPGFDSTSFHVYFKCEQCGYLEHCRRQLFPCKIPKDADLSSVPGMSHQSKANLKRLGVHTVSQMANWSPRHGDTAWALKTRGPIMAERATALEKGEVGRIEDRYCWQLPPATDLAIYLAVDSDPIDGNLVTFAARVVDGEEVHQHIGLIREAHEELPVLIETLQFIWDFLNTISKSNEEGRTSKVAHFMTYEVSEALDLRDAISRHLNVEELRNRLLDFVRIFPPEEVIPEPEYKSIHHLPSCSLRTIIENHFSLPVAVAFDLRQVTRVLAEKGLIATHYEPSRKFEQVFSSRLGIEVTREWRTRNPDLREAIDDDVNKRLDAIQVLHRWLELEDTRSNPPFLRLKKAPFKFLATIDPLNAGYLDTLNAHELLDVQSALLTNLSELSRPHEERRDRLRCYANLKLTKKWTKNNNVYLSFAVPSESLDCELGHESFSLVLTNNDPDVLLNPSLWKYFTVNLMPLGPRYERNVLCQIKKKIFESPQFQGMFTSNGDGPWFIDEVHADFNSARVRNFLSYLGGNQ